MLTWSYFAYNSKNMGQCGSDTLKSFSTFYLCVCVCVCACACACAWILIPLPFLYHLQCTNVLLRMLVQKFVHLTQMIDIYGVWIWKTLKCSGSLRHDPFFINQMNLSSDKSLNKPVITPKFIQACLYLETSVARYKT